MLEKIFNSFVPLFFAIDVIGILPMYIGMTRNIFVEKRNRIVNQASITAFFIGIGFVYLGKEVFHLLGITVPDFKIGGGILLLIIAILDLLFSDKAERGTNEKIETMGIVPIGMPLIIGPAVLTTLLLSVGTNGYNATLIAFIFNLLIVWLVFRYSEKVIRIIGEAGAIAIGKVFSLLLTAIAVMMIRVGITEMIAMVKAGG
ncbi:MAG: MarC family protein [Oligoflexia bacterium]|nr:MarC family protein [Oligoflexia bacterium]